jgi:hypothetical protein
VDKRRKEKEELGSYASNKARHENICSDEPIH